MHRRDEQRRSAIACRQPAGFAAEDFCFTGAGVKGNAMPIVRGAGDETSGAGQGRQTLVWAQGAARPVDERLARTEAERRPTCPAPGRGRKAPPSWVAVYGSPYWVLPAENVSQKSRVHEAGAFEK